jgi:hypothetical protein
VSPGTLREKGMRLSMARTVAVMRGTESMWIHLFLHLEGSTLGCGGSCRRKRRPVRILSKAYSCYDIM